MNTYRFSDECTSDERSGKSLYAATEEYFKRYDTSALAAGELFDVRAYLGQALVAVITAEADGKGGVGCWTTNRGTL